jgi:porin
MTYATGFSWKGSLCAASTATAILLTARLATAQSPGNLSSSSTLPPSSTSGYDDKLTGGWWGERKRLEDRGISINAQWVVEGFENSQGGVSTGVAAASTFDLNLAVDTEKAFGWKGGEFYGDLEDHAGRNPAADLSGDIQNFDKLNFTPYLQIFEFWYQQQLFNGMLRVKAGKIDANTEFSVIDNGLPFLNASTQVTPTITPFPTTPDPMPSADVFFTPVQYWYASFMASYANRSDTFGDFRGHPQSIQPTESGTLLLAETGVSWKEARVLGGNGNLKLGAWGDTGTFSRFDGSSQRGSGGVYAILDQTLWQPKGEPVQGRGVRAFWEGGRTERSVSAIDWNTTAGITWTGPLKARENDILGFSANYAHLSPETAPLHQYELALEWIYQASVTKWATLMPDFQFIIHPGGKYSNAAVGALDLTVQF